MAARSNDIQPHNFDHSGHAAHSLTTRFATHI
jgi:hypothetical protein